MKPFTIGQVASRAGVGVETVRFYERRGLLEEPARRASGYRQYSEDAVRRLLLVKKAKALGFTLREIADLIGLRLEPGSTRSDVRGRAEAKVADIDAKISDLQGMRIALAKLIAACDGHGPLDGCPILAALDEPGGEHQHPPRTD
jgi:DNA-binding transcriptional MerR regulator